RSNPCAGGRAQVPAKGDAHVFPGHRRDSASRHLPDYEVAGVRNVEIATAVKRHSVWAVKLGAAGRGRRSVPGESRGAVARERANRAAGINLAHPIVVGVRNVEIAGVEEEVRWAPEERVRGR